MKQFDSLSALKARAADPDTPPEALKKLLATPIVGAVAAGNPNLPEENLLEAIPRYPDETLANPALQLALAMRPELLDQIYSDDKTLHAVLGSRNCPDLFIQYALANPTKARIQALLTNPTLTGQHLLAIEDIVRNSVSGIRIKDVRLHANHPKGTPEDPESVLMRELALASTRVPIHSLRGAPIEYLTALLNGNGEDYARELGRLPDQLLISEHPSPKVRAIAAKQHNAEPALLERLARDPDASVRAAAASNQRLPAAAVNELARDPDKAVRVAVASHPLLSQESAAELLADDDSEINEAIAGHESCPPDTLRQLWRQFNARSDHRGAWPVVRNPNCPAEVLIEVLQVPFRIAKKSQQIQREYAAGHPNLPREWMPKLVNDQVGVRRSLAQNPNLTEEVALQLAQDSDSWVRKAVAENRATPDYIRAGQRNDPDDEVRRAAGVESEERDEGYTYGLHYRPNTELLGLALSRETYPSSLHWLAANVDVPLIRLAVALNPSASSDTLELLAGDAHKTVRAAARSRLREERGEEEDAPTVAKGSAVQLLLTAAS